MKRITTLLFAVVLVALIGMPVQAEIDVINHGTNLAFIASNNTTDTATIASSWLGPVQNVYSYSSIQNLLTNQPPTQLIGNRLWACVVNNSSTLSCGIKLGGYTNGATADMIVLPLQTKVIPLGGGYNGIISARSLTSTGGTLTYFEMGGQPTGIVQPLSWANGGLVFSAPASGDASTSPVASAAKSNGQQRVSFTLCNTGVCYDVGIRFAGSYANGTVPDAVVRATNGVFSVNLVEPYNGPISTRVLVSNLPDLVVFSEWGN